MKTDTDKTITISQDVAKAARLILDSKILDDMSYEQMTNLKTGKNDQQRTMQKNMRKFRRDSVLETLKLIASAAEDEGSRLDQENVRKYALRCLDQYLEEADTNGTSWGNPGRYLILKLDQLITDGPVRGDFTAKSGHGVDDVVAEAERLKVYIAGYKPSPETANNDDAWMTAVEMHRTMIENLPYLSHEELINWEEFIKNMGK